MGHIIKILINTPSLLYCINIEGPKFPIWYNHNIINNYIMLVFKIYNHTHILDATKQYGIEIQKYYLDVSASYWWCFIVLSIISF